MNDYKSFCKPRYSKNITNVGINLQSINHKCFSNTDISGPYISFAHFKYICMKELPNQKLQLSGSPNNIIIHKIQL